MGLQDLLTEEGCTDCGQEIKRETKEDGTMNPSMCESCNIITILKRRRSRGS